MSDVFGALFEPEIAGKTRPFKEATMNPNDI